jgi:hypothetical protein
MERVTIRSGNRSFQKAYNAVIFGNQDSGCRYIAVYYTLPSQILQGANQVLENTSGLGLRENGWFTQSQEGVECPMRAKFQYIIENFVGREDGEQRYYSGMMK